MNYKWIFANRIIQKRPVNKYFKNDKQKESGVTLMVLVITIIVLLILAGITIQMSLDDNGIIKQAQRAKNTYESSRDDEQIALGEATNAIQDAMNSSGGSSGSTGGGSSSGGSSGSDDDDLKQQLEDLTNENDKLKQDNEDLKTENDGLKDENNNLKDDNDALKDKNNDLQKENDELKNKNNDLQSKQATGNATTSQVLAGATFSNSSKVGLTGTMINRTIKTNDVAGINSAYSSVPTWNGTWLQYCQSTNGTYRISICPPEGYYPGNGTAYVGADASEFGDATAADVTSGKTFTSKDGLKITGNGSAQSNSYNAGYSAGYSAGSSNGISSLSGTWKTANTSWLYGWTSYGGNQEAQQGSGKTVNVSVTNNLITISNSGGERLYVCVSR